MSKWRLCSYLVQTYVINSNSFYCDLWCALPPFTFLLWFVMCTASLHIFIVICDVHCLPSHFYCLNIVKYSCCWQKYFKHNLHKYTSHVFWRVVLLICCNRACHKRYLHVSCVILMSTLIYIYYHVRLWSQSINQSENVHLLYDYIRGQFGHCACQ